MTEQWFLDLDGVRSGPYQTPEIMGLIAEGEVLPHHRISMGLRDQEWISILDWRLEQAKHLSPSRSEVTPIDDTDYRVPAAPEIPIPSQEVEEVVVEEDKSISFEIIAPPPKPSSHSHSNPARSTDKPKRDPMAEMFDMLQNTKQKREAKQSKAESNSISIEHDSPSTQKSSGFGRTLLIGGGITLIGFALGQVFQQSAPAPEPLPLVSKPSSSVAPPPSSSPAHSASSVGSITDRSTDKMTIRAIEHKNEPSAPPAKTVPHSTHASAAESPQNEKELEELRNLKKELQELKALKSNSAEDELEPEGDGFDAKEPTLDPIAPRTVEPALSR